MENNKENRYEKYRNVTMYLPKEIRQQLIFYCKYSNTTPSGLCSKLVKYFLNKKNVEQLMIDYAMEQIEANTQSNN